jgi:pyruvate dehydrogenase E1 component alpha subunit
MEKGAVRIETLHVMAEGDAPTQVPEGLDTDALVRMYRAMVLLRTFDERAVALQRQGRIGTYPPFWGEEATQVGALFACESADWIFPSYRQSALGILRGIPVSTILKYRRGYGGAHGFWSPRRHRVAPICIPIATHLPHAVGLAWAARISGDTVASLVYFGDGATSEGDFHEAMNMAAVQRAPVIFFCVNNQWAISTPFSRQTATATVAEKAAAYAMPGVRVDGTDALACYEGTRRALKRARAAQGPTLIEAVCYRIGPHATADDPSRYRDADEAAAWREREPVGRMAACLRTLGLLDAAAEEAAHGAARAAVEHGVEELDAVAEPTTDVLFDYLYASERPWTLQQDAVP